MGGHAWREAGGPLQQEVDDRADQEADKGERKLGTKS